MRNAWLDFLAPKADQGLKILVSADSAPGHQEFPKQKRQPMQVGVFRF
jgi:hypothetical protein